MIRINKNSWHYKFISSTGDDPKTVLGYIYRFLYLAFLIAFLIAICISAFLLIVYMLYTTAIGQVASITMLFLYSMIIILMGVSLSVYLKIRLPDDVWYNRPIGKLEFYEG